MSKNVIGVINTACAEIGCISFDWYGNIRRTHRPLSLRKAKNKTIVVLENNCCDVKYEFNNIAGKAGFAHSTHDKLFVSPGCKVPRDLYRGSGYHLTHDKIKADFIVLPDLPRDPYMLDVDLVAVNNRDGSVHFYTVNRLYGAYKQRFEDDFERIKNFLGEDYKIISEKIEPLNVFFIPRCEEYKENLLEEEYAVDANFVFEKNVPITTATEISPEVLEIWKRISDNNMLAQSIVNSNWKEYPFTLCVFLYLEQPYCWTASPTGFRYVLEQIGFDIIRNSYNSLWETIKNRTVTPKDWNMLQDYIMRQLSLNDDKGFISQNKLESIGKYSRFIKSAFAVAARKITEDTVIANIPELQQNFS